MNSSPSPTSIITSINQSNYLCSQSSDAPSTQNSNSDDIFVKPTKNVKEALKSPGFKQVVIVQQSHSARIATQLAQKQQNFIINGQVHFKTSKTIGAIRRPDKEENYDFKNLAIDNHVQRFPPTSLQGASINKTELYQQVLKINDYNPENYQRQTKIDEYNPDKPKYFLPNFTENGVHLQNSHLRNDVTQNFMTPGTLSHNFIMKGKNEPQEKTDDDSYAINNDKSFPGQIKKGSPPNE